jgi:hypothetical protein
VLVAEANPERRHQREAAARCVVIPGGEAGAVEAATGLERIALRKDLADRGLHEPAVLETRGVAAEARGESQAGGLVLIQTGRVPRADKGGEAVGPEVSLPLRAKPAIALPTPAVTVTTRSGAAACAGMLRGTRNRNRIAEQVP